MKKKEIIVCILAIFMLLVSISNVFAMDDFDEPSGSIDLDDNETQQIITNNANVNVSINNTNNVDDFSGTNKDQPATNTNIPNTGIADTPIIPIVICVVSAIVAYTQIRKYNV